MAKYPTFLYLTATILAGLGWAISIAGACTNVAFTESLLTHLAGQTITLTPPLHYWLTMASTAFFGVGVLFWLSATRWFPNLYLVMGSFNMVVGLALIAYGVTYGFHLEVMKNDIGFVLSTGMVILATGRFYHKKQPEKT